MSGCQVQPGGVRDVQLAVGERELAIGPGLEAAAINVEFEPLLVDGLVEADPAVDGPLAAGGRRGVPDRVVVWPGISVTVGDYSGHQFVQHTHNRVTIGEPSSPGKTVQGFPRTRKLDAG